MRKWGVQKFLNAPDHDDSGFVTAYVMSSDKRWSGVNATLTIADCDRRAHLDFSTIDIKSDGTSSKQDCDVALASIRERRGKVKRLRSVVVTFCDKMDEFLNAEEAYVKAYRKGAVDKS